MKLGVSARRLLILPAILAVWSGCSGEVSDSPPGAGAGGVAGGAGAGVPTSEQAWHLSMTKSALPKPGCFKASYPSTTWEQVACSTAREPRLVPPRGGVHHGSAQVVGDGHGDFVSDVSTGAISWSQGSFPKLLHVTSVDDECPTNGTFLDCAANGGGLGAGAFGLQLNTNTFNTNVCPPGSDALTPPCQGWAQFVYTAAGDEVFMQYWLIDFCPPTANDCSCPTGGNVTWAKYDNGTSPKHQWDCWTPYGNPTGVFPPPKVTDLDKVMLTATTGATNTVFMYFPYGNLVAQSSLDDAVGLNSGDWKSTEFNVFGAGNGSDAIFNPEALLTVQTLTYPNPNPSTTTVTTACDSTSFTGETNDRVAWGCWTVPGGIQFTEGPPLIINVPSAALAFNPLGWIDWIDGRPGQPGPPDPLPYWAVTDTSQIVQLSGASATNRTTSFSATALSLLGGVAAGTADALVGDDVAEGIQVGTSPLSVVVVAHGTTTVQGALHGAGGRAEGIAVTPLGTNIDPPDLRAYDAYDSALFSLHATPSGASLTNVDVAAALRAQSQVTSIPLVGAIPEAPLALVWNRFTRSLFVADVLADRRTRRKALRLLAIDPVSGEARELWRTRDVGRGAPSSAYLSVSARGEIVLGLDRDGFERDTEIVLLDAAGVPQRSIASERDLAGAPQALSVGVSVPVPAAVRDGIGDDVGTRVEFVPREDLRQGICGAPWLATHATGTLARDAKACGWADDDDDDR